METEIFTCKYFKFGRNTTGLSQSHLRNFLACSIKREIVRIKMGWKHYQTVDPRKREPQVVKETLGNPE